MIKKKYDKNSIYNLLPSIYRQKDAIAGYPLRDLLDIFSEQIELIQNDIEDLYDYWFIATCKGWLIPYIGELIGAIPFNAESRSYINLRALVANTISYNKRKGTTKVIQEISEDVTQWGVEVIEFFDRIITSQNINNLRSHNLCTPHLKKIESTVDLSSPPFNNIAHTVDTHKISSNSGYYNIPNIAIFLWRINAFPVNHTPVFDQGNGRFSFNQLGLNIQLFNNPKKMKGFLSNGRELNTTNQDQYNNTTTNIILKKNLPLQIKYDQLKKFLHEYYYLNEENKNSIKIEIDGQTVNIKDILVADLSNWECKALTAGKVAIDPELGRILVSNDRQTRSIYVNYYYGFSSKVGAGFYNRSGIVEIPFDKSPIIYEISKDGTYDSIKKAISAWNNNSSSSSDVIFEIIDSETYNESFEICIPKREKPKIIIRSVQNKNPVIIGNIRIIGNGEEGEIMLEGLTIVSSNLVTTKEKIIKDRDSHSIIAVIGCASLDNLILRYCTLITKECNSIFVDESNDNLNVLVDHCIINGSIRMAKSQTLLTIKDTIVNGNIIESLTNGKINYKTDTEQNKAINCYQINKIINSTILGKVNAEILQLASNTIFSDLVTIKKIDVGCIRYSFIPENSRIPRTFKCHPKCSTIKRQQYQQEKANKKGNNDDMDYNIIIKPIFKSQTFSTSRICATRPQYKYRNSRRSR